MEARLNIRLEERFCFFVLIMLVEGDRLFFAVDDKTALINGKTCFS